MPRDYLLYLDDMREAIERVMTYTPDVSFDSFSQDTLRIDAVVRNLEVIREAAKHVPESFRTRYSDVPWRRITGLRDVLAHAYFSIDLPIVWNIVQVELPPLLASVTTILDSESGNPA